MLRYRLVETGHIVVLDRDGRELAEVERLGRRRWRVALTAARTHISRSNPEFPTRRDALAWLDDITF